VAVADSRDVNSLVAIYALNALVGAYGKPGGVLFDTEVPLASGSAPRSGALADRPNAPRAPLASVAPDLLSLMTAMGAGQVKALLVIDGNPLFTLPEQDKLRSALGGVPFVASFSSFLDETAAMADLILPNHVPLERWMDDVPEPGVGFPVRTLAQPVVQPRWQTRDAGDVLLEAAKTLGGKTAEALLFDNMAAAVKESFKPVHALNTGNVSDDDFNAFFKKVTAAGGWWDAAAAGPQAVKIKFIAPVVSARAFAGDAGQFPFLLHVYPSQAFSDGRTAHLPWLQEMPDPMTTVMWGSWVEVNPQTALKLDLHEGDVLTVKSPHGSVEAPVYIFPGLRPDVIAIPVGQGHTHHGRYAANRGANPLRLLGSTLDQNAGAVVHTSVRVSAAKTGKVELPIRFGSSAPAEAPLHR
jgi:anaerobic selenocysteine-containing dehydrogenase